MELKTGCVAAVVTALMSIPVPTSRQLAPSTQAPAHDGAPQPDARPALDHLAKAQVCLEELSKSAVSPKVASKIAQLKGAVLKLRRAYEAVAAGKIVPWDAEFGEVDRVLTELLGPAAISRTIVAEPASGATQSASAAEEPSAHVRSQLEEVRRHVQGFRAVAREVATSRPPVRKVVREPR